MSREHERRIVHQAASWCLSYPDQGVLEAVPMIRAAVSSLSPGPAREDLTTFLDYLVQTPLGDLQRAYVETFDLTAKRSLYLSYWTDGDTRRRGEVLVGFVHRYRASGFAVDSGGELADFLPLVLEYAAVADPPDGRALLQEYRACLELLRFALDDLGSRYAALLHAVCETLPGLSPKDRAAAHAMAAAGPPREDVGLDAYNPRLLPLAGSRT